MLCVRTGASAAESTFGIRHEHLNPKHADRPLFYPYKTDEQRKREEINTDKSKVKFGIRLKDMKRLDASPGPGAMLLLLLLLCVCVCVCVCVCMCVCVCVCVYVCVRFVLVGWFVGMCTGVCMWMRVLCFGVYTMRGVCAFHYRVV